MAEEKKEKEGEKVNATFPASRCLRVDSANAVPVALAILSSLSLALSQDSVSCH